MVLRIQAGLKLFLLYSISILIIATCSVGYAEGFTATLQQTAGRVEIWAYQDVKKQDIATIATGIKNIEDLFSTYNVSFDKYVPKIMLTTNQADYEYELYMTLTGQSKKISIANLKASMSGGVSSGSGIVIHVNKNYPKDGLAVITAHEVAHNYQHFLTPRTKDRIPQWYKEGTADYWALKCNSKSYKETIGKYYWNMLISEREVPLILNLKTNSEWESVRSKGDNTGFTYALAYHAVNHLADTYGMDKLINVFKVMEEKNISQLYSFEQAFNEVFGITVDQFAETYNKRLQAAHVKINLAPSKLSVGNSFQDEQSIAIPQPMYKGYRENWNSIYAVHEFDLLAPPPGLNWRGSAHDWIVAAKYAGWQVIEDANTPVIGAIIVRSDTVKNIVWIGIVRKYSEGLITVEYRSNKGIETYTMAVAELAAKNFKGYIVPIRLK